jgi:hypothetical protein
VKDVCSRQQELVASSEEVIVPTISRILEKFLDQKVDGIILQEELWKCLSHGKYERPFDTFGKRQTGRALLGVHW